VDWNGVGFVELGMEKLIGLGIRLIRGLVLITREVLAYHLVSRQNISGDIIDQFQTIVLKFLFQFLNL